MAEDVRPAVVFQVTRILVFANETRVSLPMKLCTDEREAAQLAQMLQDQLEARKTQPEYQLVFGELGIKGFGHCALQLQAPDSRILRPHSGLMIPQA